MSLTDQIQKVKSEFSNDLEEYSPNGKTVDQMRVKYLGRKGLVANLFVLMGEINLDDMSLLPAIISELLLFEHGY